MTHDEQSPPPPWRASARRRAPVPGVHCVRPERCSPRWRPARAATASLRACSGRRRTPVRPLAVFTNRSYDPPAWTGPPTGRSSVYTDGANAGVSIRAVPAAGGAVRTVVAPPGPGPRHRAGGAPRRARQPQRLLPRQRELGRHRPHGDLHRAPMRGGGAPALVAPSLEYHRSRFAVARAPGGRGDRVIGARGFEVPRASRSAPAPAPSAGARPPVCARVTRSPRRPSRPHGARARDVRGGGRAGGRQPARLRPDRWRRRVRAREPGRGPVRRPRALRPSYPLGHPWEPVGDRARGSWGTWRGVVPDEELQDPARQGAGHAGWRPVDFVRGGRERRTSSTGSVSRATRRASSAGPQLVRRATWCA
jgi:hypothetical protein